MPFRERAEALYREENMHEVAENRRAGAGLELDYS